MARPRKKDELDIADKAVTIAITLMQTRGAPVFSLAELAREIGCSAPALYNHYAGKEDLLRHVRKVVLADSIAKKQARYSKSANVPLELLREGGLSYLEFAQQNPALYRLVYCPDITTTQPGSIDTISEKSLAALSAGVRASQLQGYVVDYNAEDLARTMWSTVHGAAILALDQLSQGGPDPWPKAKRVVEMIIALIENTKPKH